MPEAQPSPQQADFARHLHQSFRIALPGAPASEVELIEVRSLIPPDEESETRRAFSLVFRGGAERQPKQGIYAVENDAMGKRDIFLVPIGPDRVGMRYEAIFNLC